MLNSTLGSVVPLAMFHFCIQDSRLMDVCRKVWLYFPVWKSGKRREDNAGVRSCKLYQPYPLLQNIYVLSFLSYCSMRKRLLGAKQLLFLDIFFYSNSAVVSKWSYWSSSYEVWKVELETNRMWNWPISPLAEFCLLQCCSKNTF